MRSFLCFLTTTLFSLSIALAEEGKSNEKGRLVDVGCYFFRIEGTKLKTFDSFERSKDWSRHSLSIGFGSFTPLVTLPPIENDQYLTSFDGKWLNVTTKKGGVKVLFLDLSLLAPSAILNEDKQDSGESDLIVFHNGEENVEMVTHSTSAEDREFRPGFTSYLLSKSSKPIGILGKPLGEILELRCKRVVDDLWNDSVLVESINGKEVSGLQEIRFMSLPDAPVPLPKMGESIVVKGYESGGYSGAPHEAIEHAPGLKWTGHKFRPVFVALKRG